MTNIYKKIKLDARMDKVRTGKTEFVFGEEGTDISKLRDPFHFSINPTKDFILFCNTYDNNLQIYTLEGDFITTLSNEQVYCLFGVLYAKDSICATVFTGGNSPYLKQFTDFGTRSVTFNGSIDCMWDPRGLACDSEQNIYSIVKQSNSVIMFEKNMEDFHKIDISPHPKCVDMFIDKDCLFLFSQSPASIIKLTLKGEFIFVIDCSQFISSFSHSYTFCPDGNGSIIMSTSRRNEPLCIIDEFSNFSLIYLPPALPDYLDFRRIAAIYNSRLILCTINFCISVVVT